MSEAKLKRNSAGHTGFEWAGAIARIRRGGKSMRAGRRSALLGVLTSAYVNSSRNSRPVEPRGGSERG